MAEKSALSLLIVRFYKFRGTVVQWSGSCPAGDNLVVSSNLGVSTSFSFVHFLVLILFLFLFFYRIFSLRLVSLYFYWSPFQHGKIFTIITYF